MTIQRILLLFIFIVFVFTSPASFAQNAGGVFGPVVNDSHRAAQYRITFDDAQNKMVNRIHFEDAVNDDVMLRIVAQSRKTDQRNFDTDFVQGEAFWQITDNDQRFQTGLRFDAKLRSDDRAHLIGIHWMSQYAVTENMIARGLVMNSVEFGRDAKGGLGLQTRAALIYNMHPFTLSAELYNVYGFSDDFNDFEDQKHQIGPQIDYRIGQYDIRLGQLFGLTSASADSETRFWFARRF